MQVPESIKNETQAAVIEAKNCCCTKNCHYLAPVLTQAPTQVEESLKAISTAVANASAPTSNEDIASAITQIQTNSSNSYSSHLQQLKLFKTPMSSMQTI